MTHPILTKHPTWTPDHLAYTISSGDMDAQCQWVRGNPNNPYLEAFPLDCLGKRSVRCDSYWFYER